MLYFLSHCIVFSNVLQFTIEDILESHLVSTSFLQFGAKICLLTSFRDRCFIEIVPKDQNPTRGKGHHPYELFHLWYFYYQVAISFVVDKEFSIF